MPCKGVGFAEATVKPVVFFVMLNELAQVVKYLRGQLIYLSIYVEEGNVRHNEAATCISRYSLASGKVNLQRMES